SEPVHVDVRVIAATHQPLEEMVRQGRFREDLFFRLNVLPIILPPLRERVEDVPELVAHFLRLYAGRSGKAVTGVDDDALCLLKAYPWPGNVRQLENVIERAVVIADGPLVTVADLPPEVQALDAEVVAEEWLPRNGAELAGSLRQERAESERREREHL